MRETPSGFGDVIPSYQSTIETANVRRFAHVMRLLDDMEYKVVYLLTGSPGIGKTISIINYYNDLAPSPYNGLRSALVIKLESLPTRLSVAHSLLHELREKVTSRQYSPELGKTVVKALIKNPNVSRIIVDDVEKMSKEVLDFLLTIFDSVASVHLVLVGNQEVMKVINPIGKFSDRIGGNIILPPPTEEEVINNFLPNFILPNWKYSISSPDQVELGKYLWKLTSPSLRKLRNLLQSSSIIAGNKPITRSAVNRAVALAIPPKQAGYSDTYQKTPFELESEERNLAKETRKK